MPESIRQIMDGLPKRPDPAPAFAIGDRVQVAGVPSLAGTVTDVRPPTASLAGCVGVTWDQGGLLWVGTGGIEPAGPAPIPPLPEVRPIAVFVPHDPDDPCDPSGRGVVHGSWCCPICLEKAGHGGELAYWENYGTYRTMAEDHTTASISIDANFEWGEGDDDPGLVCVGGGWGEGTVHIFGLPLALPEGVDTDWV